MSTPQPFAASDRTTRLLRAILALGFIVAALWSGLESFTSDRIERSTSSDYSLRGLIVAHGHVDADMLGPVPRELPLIIDYLYRGREIHLGDAALFSKRALGRNPHLVAEKFPVVPPAVAAMWRHKAHRQLVYNPFSYSDEVRAGVAPVRTTWPALVRLLPPREAGHDGAPVVVTEVDGVVYFVPVEWLDESGAPLVSVLGERLLEPFLVGAMWLVGWCFVRWGAGPTARFAWIAGAALPVGLGLWSLFYWAWRVLLDRAAVLGSTGTLFVLFCVTFIAPLCFLRSWRTGLSRQIPLLVGALSVLIVASLALMRFGSYTPTVDSFRLLSSENSPVDSLALGFPVLLSALGALGTVTGNGFVGTVFPLLYGSLVLVTALGFCRFASLYPSRWWAGGVGLLLIALFFGVSPLARLQSSYVNSHVFHASCLLILLFTLLEARSGKFAPERALAHGAFIVVVTICVCLSRMEGALMAVVLLASLLFSGMRSGVAAGRRLPLLVALTVVGWCLVLGLVLNNQTFVSATQYVIIGALAIGLSTIGLLDVASSGYQVLAKHGRSLMLAGGLTVVYAIHVIEPSHMGVSSLNVVKNLFTPSGGWGDLWWWVMAAVVVLYGLLPDSIDSIRRRRDAGHAQLQRYLLSFVLWAVLVTVAIGLFRQPYRLGWSDSANRILFQIVPVFVVWFYGAIGAALNGAARADRLALEPRIG